MTWYPRVLDGIKAAVPFLNVSQTLDLALLVCAILDRRTLNLSHLAQAYPIPEERRVECPKHGLLHRIKRLSRFLGNDRVDNIAMQASLIPHTLARLGNPRWLGLAIDWTMFDTLTPGGQRVRYQVLRIALPRRGRALALLQLAYDRDRLPAPKSQNRLKEEALLAVIDALPPGVRPVILGDRGFARANFLAFLQAHGLDYAVRINRGTCMTEADGRSWKLGSEGTEPGQLSYFPSVRYALHHGRPTELVINLAVCWRLPRHQARNPRCKEPKEPWYLASSLGSAGSVISLTLELLTRLGNLPLACLPSTSFRGGYA